MTDHYAMLNNNLLSQPDLSKEQIKNILYPFTLIDAIEDFEKLKNNDCSNTKSKAGMKMVDYFTSIERLNTKGRIKFSYFDLYYNFNYYYNKKNYIRNGINNVFKGTFFENTERQLRNLNSIFKMYYGGSICAMRPIIIKDLIRKYRPKKILDFTMGWGGRLIGACSEDVDEYIGIDMNTNLEPLYNEMTSLLNQLSQTKIALFFQDALTIDYNRLDYDFVFTSPPYYNIEIYNNCTIRKSKEQWKQEFYYPLFERTFNGLKEGGIYCLNVPQYIYEEVCISVLGQCNDMIPLNNPRRNCNTTYQEYIYIWQK